MTDQETQNRESFIFYRSFFEALVGMENDVQGQCLMALADYALNGKEPTMTPEVRMFFTLVKPQVDANKKKYENGCKGGRPKNQTETKAKPKDNQTETKPEPNDNDNVNDNVNIKENFIKEKSKKILVEKNSFFLDQSMGDYKDLLKGKSDEFCLKVWKWIFEHFKGRKIDVSFVRSIIQKFNKDQENS